MRIIVFSLFIYLQLDDPGSPIHQAKATYQKHEPTTVKHKVIQDIAQRHFTVSYQTRQLHKIFHNLLTREKNKPHTQIAAFTYRT